MTSLEFYQHCKEHSVQCHTVSPVFADPLSGFTMKDEDPATYTPTHLVTNYNEQRWHIEAAFRKRCGVRAGHVGCEWVDKYPNLELVETKFGGHLFKYKNCTHYTIINPNLKDPSACQLCAMEKKWAAIAGRDFTIMDPVATTSHKLYACRCRACNMTFYCNAQLPSESGSPVLDCRTHHTPRNTNFQMQICVKVIMEYVFDCTSNDFFSTYNNTQPSGYNDKHGIAVFHAAINPNHKDYLAECKYRRIYSIIIPAHMHTDREIGREMISQGIALGILGRLIVKTRVKRLNRDMIDYLTNHPGIIYPVAVPKFKSNMLSFIMGGVENAISSAAASSSVNYDPNDYPSESDDEDEKIWYERELTDEQKSDPTVFQTLKVCIDD